MQAPVTRLYPAPGSEQPLEGLYLDHRLHTRGNPGRPFIFSNFVTSLDGRIAISADGRDTHIVPGAIANPRDWRLYQELAGQADLLITSGRFLRQSISGEAQANLPVGNEEEYADIRDWRIEQGLSAQPDIAVLSANLDIPLEALTPYKQRNIKVITGEKADPQRIAALRHTLLATGAIDRLYLTIAHQLLGGDAFDTLTRGALLNPTRGMQLVQLYHDPHCPEGAGQMFCVYEPGHS
jgi:riboflavin biosynthesis pyrimidine reductase